MHCPTSLVRSLGSAVLLCLPLLAHGADYRFGVFAGSASKDNQSELRAEFKLLADYIAQKTGSNVRLEISQSFKNMENRLNNESHFAFLLAPAQVTADAIEGGFVPVAKWNKPLFGIFVVAADAPYKSIPELRSAHVGLASRDTAIGPLCMDAITKSKLRADRDFGSVYEGKFMDVLTKEMKSGNRDAVCISPIAWKTLNQEAPGAFRVLAETARIPGFALSINDSLDEQDKKKLTAALTGLGGSAEGKAALAKITGSASGATDTPAASSAEYVTAGQLLSQGKQLYDRQIPKR
jgi:ABC-type phosphate/phosphonate transport system substrate-binding protein